MVLFKSISPPQFPYIYFCDTKLGRKVSESAINTVTSPEMELCS